MSDEMNYPYFGEDDGSNDFRTPYANSNDYLLSEFNNKEVSVKQIETYEDYNTNGPVNAGISPDTQSSLDEKDEVNSGSNSIVVTDTTSVIAKRSAIVNYAKQFIGKQYLWGGTWNGSSKWSATDCSGFVQGLYAHYSEQLTRTTNSQAAEFKKNQRWISNPEQSDLRKGDLIYYTASGGTGHVAMYVGSGRVIHASGRKSGVKISNPWNYRTVYGVGRVWGKLSK